MKQLNKIQERFISIRRELKLSQLEFAIAANLKQSQVSQVETGARNITSDILLKLEDLLNVNRKWLESGEGEMFIITKYEYSKNITNAISGTKLNEPDTEYRAKLVKSASVPIYDVEFSAGIIRSLVESRDNHYPVGYLSIPEVSGCDAIIRAKGDSMADRINDRDWIGIKRINKDDWFPLGFIYAIETEQAQVIKYIKKGSTDKTIKIVSHNSFYDDEEIPLDLIKELWSVRAILPFSKIETLI